MIASPPLSESNCSDKKGKCKDGNVACHLLHYPPTWHCAVPFLLEQGKQILFVIAVSVSRFVEVYRLCVYCLLPERLGMGRIWVRSLYYVALTDERTGIVSELKEVLGSV